MSTFTIDDMRQTMRECLGDDEDLDLGGEISDRSFDDLGFDSLAVMETISRIGRQLGIRIQEEAVEEAPTPGALVRYVNEQLQQAATRAERV